MPVGPRVVRGLALIFACAGFLPAIAPAGVPAGFVLETYVSGLDSPVDLEWAANGLLFVAEKGGTVAVIDNGARSPAPFINIRSQVNRAADRGLLGIAVHPDFPNTPYVYLLYVYDPPESAGQSGPAGPDGGGQRVSRLSRVTADAAAGYKVAIAGSEVVILGQASTWANTGDPSALQDDFTAPLACGPDGAFIDDCLPADGLGHAIGTVTFGTDGLLYVGNGDASSWTTVDPAAVRTLRLDSLAGKILRIDPDTGLGVPDNPYWNGNAASNRSRVWQLGMRNPFRFQVHPGTGGLWVADVGWEDWEELNHAPKGADFGWPCYEGANGGAAQQPGYASLPACQAYYPAKASAGPVYAYPHRSGAGGSIIAGEFYFASKWPAEYQGAMLLSDYSFQELSLAKVTGNTVTVTPFADQVLSVDLAIGPDGDMYSANIGTDSVERIRYVGGGSGGVPTRIAGFASDFTGTVPASGWSYSWNAAGTLGNTAAEAPLLWSDGRYDSDGAPGLPDATGMNYGFVGPGAMHPGLGQANGQATDRFAIARYAVPQGGYYEIRNGLLQHIGCGFGNGVELAIIVGQQVVHRHVVASAGADTITESLGYLPAGTGVAVAVGPNGTDACDEVRVDWEIHFTPGVPAAGDAPVASISSPPAGQFWRVGDIVPLAGAATDTEDGVLGGSALRWEGNIVHNTHVHPDSYFGTGSTGTFAYPDHGDNSYMELCLVATDSDSQQGSACVDVRPELSTYSLRTNVPGLSLTYNGESRATPFDVSVPVGGNRLVSAPWLQGGHVFRGWSIGGQATQQLVIGSGDQALTATYVPLPGAVRETSISLAAGSDDAEESATGGVQIDGHELNLTLDAGDQLVGLRFPGIAIQPGAVITAAYVQFTASTASSDPTTLLIEAEAGDDAATFQAQPGNISSRPRTAARISWSPETWVASGEAGLAQRTPDLAEIISEVVGRPGWQSGNAIGVIISGEGHRLARAFDNPGGGAPVLVIRFAEAAAGGPPDPPEPPAAAGGGAIEESVLAVLVMAGLWRRRRPFTLIR